MSTCRFPRSRAQASPAAYFAACFSTSAKVLPGQPRARPRSKIRLKFQLLAGKARETLPRQQHQKQSNFPRQTPRECTLAAGKWGAVPQIVLDKLAQSAGRPEDSLASRVQPPLGQKYQVGKPPARSRPVKQEQGESMVRRMSGLGR